MLIIDRFEGNFAICKNTKDNTDMDIPIDELPLGVREGDALVKNNGMYIIDTQFTESLRQEFTNKLNNLFDKKGK